MTQKYGKIWKGKKEERKIKEYFSLLLFYIA